MLWTEQVWKEGGLSDQKVFALLDILLGGNTHGVALARRRSGVGADIRMERMLRTC